MRGAYLAPICESDCQRGGVGGDGEWGDYELEIGSRSNASFAMLALCVHIDEVHEVLEKAGGVLGALVLRSIKAEQERLLADYVARQEILQREPQ